MMSMYDVDGVPTLHSPATGPMRAGLVFRVGFADEPLARHGITHLLEHLALHSLGMAEYHFNGETGVEHTGFHLTGSPSEVATFLTRVSAALHDLPMHRLPIEKDVLRAEASARGGTDPMPLWRHGAVGHGTVSYPEWGLPAITEDDLRAWAARYFTRDNAVLWVTGEQIPAGLRLTLPPGRREPSPAPASALPVTPAWFRGGPGVVAWDALVARGAATEVFADLLERAMFRELRQESGLSYTAGARWRPIGRDRALVVAFADALPEKQGAVLGGFVDVLARLRAGIVDPDDLATVVRRRGQALWEAEQSGDRLAGVARDYLAGLPVRSAEAEFRAYEAVTVTEIAAVAAAASAAGLLMAPSGTYGDWAGFTPAPNSSTTTVTGTAYESLEDPDENLIIGPDGVSVGDRTVRFADCVIMRAWPDGARALLGTDGIGISVEPTLYRGGAEIIGWLDRGVSPAVRVDQPPRDPSRVPTPSPAVPAPAPARSPRPLATPTKRQQYLISAMMSAFVAGVFVSLQNQEPVIAGLIGLTMVLFIAGVRIARGLVKPAPSR
ncbi:M16 family metallopeptidase [Actinoplanes sp. HUAS TT8]|uniref:M16 family metallopeptidase n=1 Tax=Actinoplanes sp. HUAS TT8 TaxID=3447453 RepID=UPI003F527EDE